MKCYNKQEDINNLEVRVIRVRVYLDNCCFNRPYDDQSQFKIHLETQAKLNIQSEIIQGKHELAWSFILEYENEQNPYDIRKNAIKEWKNVAKYTTGLNDEIYQYAKELLTKGIKEKDALHVACAANLKCDVFLTTDKKLLNTPVPEICIMNPINFVYEMEE